MNVTPIDGLIKTLRIIITVAALSLTIAGIISGCKKNSDKRPACSIIAAASPSLATVYHLSYNSDGKLNSVTAGATIVTYEYTGNTSIATTLDSGRFFSKKIIILNAAGLAINVRAENNPAGTDWSNNVNEYSGAELIKSTSTSSVGGSPLITTYTWLNQNLVSATS
jgi:hypothetical protein